MTRLWLWLRALLFRQRLDREMRDEMTTHLSRAAERLIAGGMSAGEARRAARLEFGPVTALQEDARDARGTQGIDSILADLRFGFRQFRRKPFSALTMIAVLALGIGVNTALFLLIYSFTNSPVPGVAPQDALVRLRGVDRAAWGDAIGREFPYPEYREYAAQESLFSAVGAWTSSDVVLDVGQRGEHLQSGAATYVTAGYFPILDIRPELGAGLPADARDDGAPQFVAVISYVVWERYFDLAPDVVGKTMKVNDVPVTIAGVAPRRFAGARTGGSHVRVWLPLNARPVVQRTSAGPASLDSAAFGLIARLRPGTDIEQTTATVRTIAARFAETTRREISPVVSTDVVPLLANNYFPPSGEPPGVAGRLTTLFVPVLILLITCTNVSALLAGLAAARRREIAVRLSLGAARRRIVRQLVTESVLLAVAAAALGLLVIWFLLKTFEASIPDLVIVLDWRAFAFTFGVAVTTGILFGLSPALHGTRLALSDVLKDATGSVVASRSRLQSGLVVAQIAFTQPALLAMGALILGMAEDLRKLPAPAFADRILQVRFNTNPRYGSIDQNREDALRRLQERFKALPGVVGVVPQENADDYFDVTVHPADQKPSGELDRTLQVRAQAAPPGYFQLLGIPVVRGREFDARESDRTAVVIDAELARRLWGAADPIGRRFIVSGRSQRGVGQYSVVGVVDETRAGRGGASGGSQRLFLPDVRITGHFLIRTQGPAQPMTPLIRSVANLEAPDLPLTSARTLASIETEQRTFIVRIITATGGSGLVALFLSAIGLYAVVAFAVGQRVREIGIRTALGANRRRVVEMFLFRGLRLSLVGLTIGLTFSVIVVRLMAASRGEEPPDGTAGLAALIACLVITVTLLATWIPARRAAHVDPLDALRAD
jgi:predicted permease